MNNGVNEPAWATTLMKEVQLTRKECADGHRDTMDAMANIRAAQTVLSSEVSLLKDEIKEIRPVVTTVALHDRAITEAESDVLSIYKMIGEDRASGRSSFWESGNARLVLIIGAALVIGLIGLAGYNISIKDFAP